MLLALASGAVHSTAAGTACDDAELQLGCPFRGQGDTCTTNCAQSNCTREEIDAFCAPGINSLHVRDIVVYHVNPAVYGDSPVNMNTGDARGDMFFR